MTDLVKLLRADGSGLEVVDRRVAPAPGSWTPLGVMAHHTAGSQIDVRGLQKGYGFPGPLCNVGIDRDGTRYVITDGRANDSGNGSSFVLNDLRAGRPVTQDAAARTLRDDINGNAYFYDIEVVNDGRGQPYPPIQLESLGVTAAALCRAHGWDEHQVIHHRQWTRRKVDMSWRGDLTGLVARYLNEEDDMTAEQERKLDQAHAALTRIDRFLQLSGLMDADGRPKRNIALDLQVTRKGIRSIAAKLGLPVKYDVPDEVDA